MRRLHWSGTLDGPRRESVYGHCVRKRTFYQCPWMTCTQGESLVPISDAGIKPTKSRRKAGTRLVVVTRKSARIVEMEQVLSLTERDMENNKAEARAPKMAVQTKHFIRQGKQQYAQTATREKLGDAQKACEHLRGGCTHRLSCFAWQHCYFVVVWAQKLDEVDCIGSSACKGLSS